MSLRPTLAFALDHMPSSTSESVIADAGRYTLSVGDWRRNRSRSSEPWGHSVLVKIHRPVSHVLTGG